MKWLISFLFLLVMVGESEARRQMLSDGTTIPCSFCEHDSWVTYMGDTSMRQEDINRGIDTALFDTTTIKWLWTEFTRLKLNHPDVVQPIYPVIVTEPTETTFTKIFTPKNMIIGCTVLHMDRETNQIACPGR